MRCKTCREEIPESKLFCVTCTNRKTIDEVMLHQGEFVPMVFDRWDPLKLKLTRRTREKPSHILMYGPFQFFHGAFCRELFPRRPLQGEVLYSESLRKDCCPACWEKLHAIAGIAVPQAVGA